ncbi:hypothetical protein [Streptacidiphilus sp. PAMC 29251]
MRPAEVVALLHRASHSGRSIAGTLTVREVAEVRLRLLNRGMSEARDRAFGAGASRFTRFLGGHVEADEFDGADRPERSEPFRFDPADLRDPDYEPADEPAGLRELLCPDWLLSGFELSVGTEQPARDSVWNAVRVTAETRPCATPESWVHDRALLSRIDLLMDRELGILLRIDEFFEDELCRTVELSDLVLDPPPPEPAAAPGKEDEADDEEDDDSFAAFKDNIPEPVRLIAQGMGAALGQAVRIGAKLQHVPEPADDEPWFDLAPASPAPDQQIPSQDELSWLLHRSGRGTPRFTAELHCWLDTGALLGVFRALRESEPAVEGIFGPEPFWSALGETAPARHHRVHRVVFADLLHYRLDNRLETKGKPLALACDGATGYRLFPDRLVTVPPAPPEFDLAQALDLSWLLRHHLVVEGLVEYGGRTALRVAVTCGPGETRAMPLMAFDGLEVLVDVELGVGLRLTAHQDGTAVARHELRDVVTAAPSTAAPSTAAAPTAAAPTGSEFALAAPSGGRTVQGGGGMLGDSALPSPVKAAAGAAGALLGGAAMLVGLLGRKRPQPQPEPSREPQPESRPEPPAPPASEA